MKTLTPHEMEQINGAGILGSGFDALGFSTIGRIINVFENIISGESDAIEPIPGASSFVIDLLRRSFQFMPKFDKYRPTN